MDSREAVDLLSRITGQKLSQRDLTPQIVFLASLVTVLVGVMFIDGTVAESEKQRLLVTLYRFSMPESDVRRLTHLIIKGVKENQLYKKSDDLLTLTAPLTESQRLLLIGFGYEMSGADGEIDSREKKYLEILAKHLGINLQHLAVLESAFTHQNNVDSVALEEVRFLLDPARFHEMDTIFVKLARDMLATIPALAETQANQQRIVISYDGLKKFQEHRQQLNNLCEQIFQIIQDCQEGGFLPHSLIKEAKEVWEKNQSQRFRLAVVGEFSQGKSTLLNALLGETIQPAREIPCSGTITVLKYGKQKRLVCLYKNGREEEIPFEEYQQKASISEDAAIDCLSDELAQSEIEELIFEHPDLELCSNGVEIVDSPGLNEHPERTAITQKLLANTDAVIFLTNASRPLTQGERNLLHDLKVHLNGGKETEPADNLFVICNFMDLIRTEKGKEQIKQRVTKFVQGDHPIVSGVNRVHFISAQAALDEILAGKEDEYLQGFRKFTSSIEEFLIFERGALKNQRSTNDINKLIQKNLDYLNQAQNTLEGKIKISEDEKQKIIEQIGEASGRDIKIRLLAEKFKEEVLVQALKSWKKWHQSLNGRMIAKSKLWSSEHSPVWSRDKLIRDYTNQFMRNLSEEIDNWGNEILKNVILREYVKLLDTRIAYQLDAIQADFKNLDIAVKTNFSNQLKLSINDINDDFMGFGGIGGGIGIGGALATALVIFTGVGFIAIIVTSVVAAIASSFGLGMLDIDGIHNKIKTKVLELGFQKVDESIDKVADKISEIINTVFDSKVESASRVINEAISLYENLLEQQEKVYQETLEEREADEIWIFQKYQELEEIQNTIKSIILN
ncbi:dynamin family protein [Nostoc sp.]|uniref:dynamin family protein n=1 Tax=Nostoc sp. TaxID=1180 RepID=UPI002FF88108